MARHVDRGKIDQLLQAGIGHQGEFPCQGMQGDGHVPGVHPLDPQGREGLLGLLSPVLQLLAAAGC